MTQPTERDQGYMLLGAGKILIQSLTLIAQREHSLPPEVAHKLLPLLNQLHLIELEDLAAGWAQLPVPPHGADFHRQFGEILKDLHASYAAARRGDVPALQQAQADFSETLRILVDAVGRFRADPGGSA